MERLTSDEMNKINAFRAYRKARQVLHYNEGFNRPGQSFYIQRGRDQVAYFEAQFPDFREAFTKIHGARYK